ncbi:PHP-associated domain-containing protein [Pseudodesulfovibrio thermohalotolerans]|uniref:PHP-associated domain-containing protein n=1 Tax=Pseudodesulfovibrio thermohalotolerans TaxID=2880651 RepID=UPI0022B9F24D|nr:PHP-associated domain-containing protein [Pseudodesulfovibrio thermohalotolerans]WFS60906.1 PHP-associated domain-containing protein [Pseudodesulfovibrio thermohalotolerans]
MQTVNWQNPYDSVTASRSWYKGNLHSHSSPASPCGRISLDELLLCYEGKGYDFISVSDHMGITPAQHPNLTLLPGFEWNSRMGSMGDSVVSHQDHLGLYSLDSEALAALLPPRELRTLLASDRNSVLTVINHPNWKLPRHYDLATLLTTAPHVDGMEIYNAVIDRLEGDAYAVREWDILLSSGFRLLGFASDDAHQSDGVGRGWIMVNADDKSPESIFDALGKGRFYASNGPAFTHIEREGDTIRVSLPDKALIRVIGQAGICLKTELSEALEWSFQEHTTPYARVEVHGNYGCQAWTQPFFR